MIPVYTTKKIAAACMGLVLLLAAGSFAQDRSIRFGGYLKGFLFQETVSPHSLDRAGGRLQLNAAGHSGEIVSFFTAVNIEFDPVREDRGNGLDVNPVEAYINFSTDSAEFRIGQQFIFWGRTTWINPTDLITGWDFINMAGEIEDYRRAPLAARVNWYLRDEFMIDIAWAPIFEPNYLGDIAPDRMDGLPVTLSDKGSPERHLVNGEFGLRLTHSISSLALDWSLAAYKGFEKFPNIEVTSLFRPGTSPPVLQSFTWINRYDPLAMFGADFAKAVGPLVFKGESAIKRTDDHDGADPVIRNSRIETVIGIDYTWSENLSFGGQYILNRLLNYDRDSERTALEKLSGQEPGFVGARTAHETSLSLNWQPTPLIGSQLIALGNITNRDFFYMAFAWWDIVDNLKAYIGGVGFGGEDPETPNAAQKDFSRLFVELKYSF